MFKTLVTQHSSITLPPEALDALGAKVGEELEIEIVGQAMVILSAEEARRTGEFMSVFDSILAQGGPAYDELANDPAESY